MEVGGGGLGRHFACGDNHQLRVELPCDRHEDGIISSKVLAVTHPHVAPWEVDSIPCSIADAMLTQLAWDGHQSGMAKRTAGLG